MHSVLVTVPKMASTQSALRLCVICCILASSLVSAQQGDGGAASGNVPVGSSGGSAAGASGSSSGAFTLSTGAIVAIALVVSLVCILGICTAILFFVAKKRQWTIRETLRRSKRRVATGLKTAMSPLTPHRATFSPSPYKTKFSDRDSKAVRGPKPLKKGQKNPGIGFDMDEVALTGGSHSRDGDLEKGQGTVVMSENKSGHRPQKPSVSIPKTGRRIAEEPKTPLFNKVFGRE